MTFVLRSFRESSQTRENVDRLFNFLTKVDSFDFLNNFLLVIVYLHIRWSVARVLSEWSATSKSTNIFDCVFTFLDSEKFDVLTWYRSKYNLSHHWLQKFLNLTHVFIDLANRCWAWQKWRVFLNFFDFF
jgi:hypothetical protein